MWIFLNDSFLSIVDKAKTAGCLVVRARKAGDIERVFPKAEVVSGKGTDYQFRAEVPREDVAKAISDRVMNIDYPNFKSSVKEQKRHDGYMGVWSAMSRFQ